jgi:hypothetical protein
MSNSERPGEPMSSDSSIRSVGAPSVGTDGRPDMRPPGPVGAPRWRLKIADSPSSSGSNSPIALVERRRPPGTPGLLMDRVLVQTSAGSQLAKLTPFVSQTNSGLVLSRGRMRNRVNLRRLITDLPRQGFDAPIVFDPEGYREHIATVEAPFYFRRAGFFADSLEENLSDQRSLGVHVAQTPTGLIVPTNVDALEAAAEQVTKLNRDDFLFTAPLDATILDDAKLTARVWGILNSLQVPVALILAGQLDPLDKNARSRVSALRAFAAGPANVAAFRTDLNAMDLICHGGFAGAIGTGGSLRHATGPDERPRSIDPTDESPSVLYGRLATWWRGSKVARVHGRSPAPECGCAACDGRRIDRFLSREDSAEAQAHAVVTWQEWLELIVEQETVASRAQFWKTFCQSRIDEHDFLSQQLRRPKPLIARPAFAAWAKLPA